MIRANTLAAAEPIATAPRIAQLGSRDWLNGTSGRHAMRSTSLPKDNWRPNNRPYPDDLAKTTAYADRRASDGR